MCSNWNWYGLLKKREYDEAWLFKVGLTREVCHKKNNQKLNEKVSWEVVILVALTPAKDQQKSKAP